MSDSLDYFNSESDCQIQGEDYIQYYKRQHGKEIFPVVFSFEKSFHLYMAQIAQATMTEAIIGIIKSERIRTPRVQGLS